VDLVEKSRADDAFSRLIGARPEVKLWLETLVATVKMFERNLASSDAKTVAEVGELWTADRACKRNASLSSAVPIAEMASWVERLGPRTRGCPSAIARTWRVSERPNDREARLRLENLATRVDALIETAQQTPSPIALRLAQLGRDAQLDLSQVAVSLALAGYLGYREKRSGRAARVAGYSFATLSNWALGTKLSE
jgi:hypothetical protein